MKLSILLFLSFLTLLTSCNGQTTKQKVKTENIVKGNSVTELGKSIMTVYQDKKNVYWFGSWETGVYKYDGKELVNYTTKHGLLNNRIDEIKEDELGNIYFVSANATSAISKFNGKAFTTLKAVPSKNWKLESTDMWFRYSYENEKKIYRYDGNTLYELELPKPPNLSNPFGVYSIYKDNNGDLWVGTHENGAYKFNGQTFERFKP